MMLSSRSASRPDGNCRASTTPLVTAAAINSSCCSRSRSSRAPALASASLFRSRSCMTARLCLVSASRQSPLGQGDVHNFVGRSAPCCKGREEDANPVPLDCGGPSGLERADSFRRPAHHRLVVVSLPENGRGGLATASPRLPCRACSSLSGTGSLTISVPTWRSVSSRLGPSARARCAVDRHLSALSLSRTAKAHSPEYSQTGD